VPYIIVVFLSKAAIETTTVPPVVVHFSSCFRFKQWLYVTKANTGLILLI
jgi:hypothetical protein